MPFVFFFVRVVFQSFPFGVFSHLAWDWKKAQGTPTWKKSAGGLESCTHPRPTDQYQKEHRVRDLTPDPVFLFVYRIVARSVANRQQEIVARMFALTPYYFCT
jgi:hypothetical protein